MFGFIIALSIGLVLLYITVEIKGNPLQAFFMKAVASFGFMMTYAAALFEKGSNDPLLYVFMLGLVAGLIGDLVLALRPLRPREEDAMIINLGILSFSVGHLFYITALLLLSAFYWGAVYVSIIMTFVVIVMSYVLKFSMGKNRITSYIYSSLIFFMIGLAVMNVSTFNFLEGRGILLIGAILFGISDLILAPIYFQKMDKPLLVTLNLLTYYGAQLLIAISIFYL